MKKDFYNRIRRDLEKLDNEKTMKVFRHLQGPMSGKTDIEGYGRTVILCSNNYLGLDNKPEVVNAGLAALGKYGAGASSVRFICGTFDIHRELEELTARYCGMEASISYTSCWAANTAAIPSLLAPGDTVISDELNHASIIDGCRAVAKGVNRAVYKHSDMADLEEKLKAAKDSETKLIITDGVFSMEGDIAPLPDIVALAERYGAIVMVDESHASGVIGKTGRGTMEYFNMTSGVDIISGTYGKALGGAGGGFIASTADVCQILAQKSRPSLFSNALPPVLCAIAMASIQYLLDNPKIVTSLREKTEYARKLIIDAGLKPMHGDSAIIPIVIGSTADAIRTSQLMMDKGVFAIGFGFPVVAEGAARIRLQISDALEYADLDFAAGVIKEAVSSVLK
ncbi:MAG: aminotransferase class I/II-fold pyridoxal phosphate-dependent enzyme [Defluviitaleaceae bacterium]|nr:aminotransferase class I/II-fold pyridoxal phosphate-dependent enzyme [Defluviitaleaceae bacterium]MCL2835774.1 aminotransferase class I/II-fold pyridoxal phosphate-dependent enzyme [Defluviitaleaceae bacterium]